MLMSIAYHLGELIDTELPMPGSKLIYTGLGHG